MYATGKIANAICDRCGLTFKLHQLKKLTINTRLTNIKVCPGCWEPDQPQYRLGKFRVTDPQALRDPRPDSNRAVSIGIAGWNPVWVNSLQMMLGNIEIGD